jgi:hypothetical protein
MLRNGPRRLGLKKTAPMAGNTVGQMELAGQIEMALRERLELGGCTMVGHGSDGREAWFTPHLNRHFAMPATITTNDDANAVLRCAGMEEAF